MQARLKTCSDPTLFLKGEIQDSQGDTEVSTVFLKDHLGSTFQVSKGQHTYLFHVEIGAGTFTIEIPGANPPTQDYDTAVDGDYGLTFDFAV